MTLACGCAAADAVASEIEDPPAIKQAPVISGTPSVGSQLTASTGSWRPSSATPSYRWLRCTDAAGCTEIEDATGLSYVVTPADAGHSLAIRLIVTADGLASAPALSTPTAVVPAPPQPPQPPAPIGEPTISGAAVVGGVLSAGTGTWSGEPLSYSYAWLLCDAHGAGCEQVPGASHSSFLLAADDIGHTLRVVVTAANAAGGASATSPPTTQVSAAEVTPSPTPGPSPAPSPSPTPVPSPAATPSTTPTSSPAPTAIAPPTQLPSPSTLTGVTWPPIRPPMMTPFPQVRVAGRFSGGVTTFTVVSVRAPRGARIALACHGPGCPYQKRAVAARLLRFRSLQRRFHAGAVIEIRVTASGVIGRYTRIRTRYGTRPSRLDRCLMPGQRRPVPCPGE